MKKIFVTGVDTDIGKTFVSIGICLALEEKGYKVGYFKPLQSGAMEKDGKLLAPDIEALKQYTNINAGLSYLLKGEVSPHLATLLSDIKVDINKIKKDYDDFSKRLDVVITEGAGGLYCPCFKGKLFADLIKELEQEIIIVTTPALGRLNHLLMTIECAKLKNIPIKGIIINKVPKNPTLSEENFERELKLYTDVKIIGKINALEKPDKKDILQQFNFFEI